MDIATNLTIEGASVTNCTLRAIFLVNSTVTIDGADIVDCGAAVMSFNGSNATIWNTSMSWCGDGFISGPASMLFGGGMFGHGLNVFVGPFSYFGYNWNTAATLSMVGNCYNGKVLPKPTKFGGPGTVAYLPGECQ